MSLEEIARFFEPASVVVVGVSRNPLKFGSAIISNLKNLQYPGKLYIVNSNAANEEILGLRCYSSVKSIEEPVDLAILAIPAQAVPGVMQDCAARGVRNIVIISSGFNEAGEAGQRYLDEILAIAHQANMMIVGPNTTGILSPGTRFTTTFVPLPADLGSGPVAFVSQTGMFAGIMLKHILSTEYFGVSRVAGLGNKCDVDDSDILEYLYCEPDTKAVMIYMEGVRRGRHFLETARWFSAKKPIVLLKGGRTPAGAKAALSHTGSLASEYGVLEDVFQQAGIILANDMEEMIDYAKILAYLEPPRGERLGVVSMSGGAAVMASDVISERRMKLAPVSSEDLKLINASYPEWATAGHPLDIEPLMEKVGGREGYRMGLETMLKCPNVDMVLLVIGMGIFVDEEDTMLVNHLAPVLKSANKPVAISLIGARSNCNHVSALLEEMNVPTYRSITRAVKSLDALVKYARIRKKC